MAPRVEQIYSTARRALRPGSELFAPLEVLDADFDAEGLPADALLEMGYRGKSYQFLVEVKRRTAPSIVKVAIWEVRGLGDRGARNPMIMVPHLSSTIVGLLEETGVSGLDLNGNYLLQLDDLVAIRLDRKNEYVESRDIKKVYAGDSSIVGRFLLREPGEFTQVTKVHEAIGALGGDISLSTVSKVLSALQEDLVIEKRGGRIRVLQAAELLAHLVDGYQPPRTGETLPLKLTDEGAAIRNTLDQELGAGNWVWDGPTSAEHYTVTTPTRTHAAYTRADPRALDRLRPFEEPRFYNCVVKRTKKSFVYFDSRAPWSSPLECYLTLMQMDKREREIAERLREEILQSFS